MNHSFLSTEHIPTRDERLASLLARAKDATDACGWADPGTPEGLFQLAGGGVALGRVLTAVIQELQQS